LVNEVVGLYKELCSWLTPWLDGLKGCSRNIFKRGDEEKKEDEKTTEKKT